MTTNERLVAASKGTETFEPFMIVAVQCPGRLDGLLSTEDAEFMEAHRHNVTTIDQAVGSTDRFTLSYR